MSINDDKAKAMSNFLGQEGALNDLEKSFWQEFTGGGGSLAAATRTDNGNPAVFPTYSDLETYTATTDGQADAARISVSKANLAKEVFAVGTLNAGGQVTSMTSAYVRVVDEWVSVATNLVGTPGKDGDGTDFSHIPTNKIPAIGADDVPFDSGLGVAADGTLETPVGIKTSGRIQSGVGTFGLGVAHSISSGGENVTFSNEATGNVFHPTWQMTGLDGDWASMQRTSKGAFQQNVVYQGDDSTSLVDPVFTVTSLPLSHRIYAVTVKPVSSIANVRIIIQRSIGGGTEDYITVENVSLVGGSDYKVPLQPFLDLEASTVLTVRVTSSDGDVTLLGNSGGVPRLLLDYWEWEDKRVALEENLTSLQTPFLSDPCIRDATTFKEILEVETIDELEDRNLILTFNASNAVFFGQSIILTASREGVVDEQLGNWSGVNEGVNQQTVSFSEADVNKLRNGSGAIQLKIVYGAKLNVLGCINIREKIPSEVITTSVTFHSTEDYNNIPNKSGLKTYESLNSGVVTLSGNTVVTMTVPETPVSLVFKVVGNSVQFEGAGNINLAGYIFPRNGDLLLCTSTGNDMTIVKVGDTDDVPTIFKPNDRPLSDQIWSKPPGEPANNTTYRLVFDSDWVGNLNLRFRLGSGAGISVGAVAASFRAQTLEYNISKAQWTTAYSGNPSILTVTWEYQDSNGAWVQFYNVQMPA